MDDFPFSYHILGIDDKNIKFNDNDSCDYTFNVQLEDGQNITFQAGYCDVGTMWTYYKPINNYIYFYLPYYYSIFKEKHQVSFSLKMAEKSFGNDNSVIIVNETNKNELCDFINYLYQNTKGVSYQIKIYNEDNDRTSYISSWNDEYKGEFCNSY